MESLYFKRKTITKRNGKNRDSRMRNSDSLWNTIDSPIDSVDSRSIWTWEKQKQIRQTESKTNVWNLRFIIVTIERSRFWIKGKQERLGAGNSSFCSSGERPRESLSHSSFSCLSRKGKFCETMKRRFKGQRFITKTTWTDDAKKNKTNIQSDNKALTVRITAKPKRRRVENWLNLERGFGKHIYMH